MAAPGDVLALARQLIERPSVTPDDAGCLDLIAARLAPLGFVCERIDAGGVANLWARRDPAGGGSKRLVCFAGHTDVVPPGDAAMWASPPFAPTERDGKLYGRGAADMKSSLAAALVACERLFGGDRRPATRPLAAEGNPRSGGEAPASGMRRGDPDGPAGNRRPATTVVSNAMAFLLTSDEEGDAINGTIRVVEALSARGVRLDACIVGEPTSTAQLGDTIKNGRRGSLSGTLLVHGVQGHVAYPHLARNPIHLAAPALAELAATHWDAGNAHFPPTSFQISNAHAGTGATNVVPGRFELAFNFRFSTASTVDALQSRVHEILDRHGLHYDLHWTLGGKPFLTEPGTLSTALAEAIREVTGIETALSTTGGTSDGRFIAGICDQVVEFGPVNASIHKVDEHVALADLEPLAAIYERAFARLLA